MKTLKKIMYLSLVATLGISLASCKDDDKDSKDVTLKVWAASEDQTMVKARVEAFKKANPDKVYNISVTSVSEADAATQLQDDPEAGADVFAFANDQLTSLVKKGALQQLGGTYREWATEQNNPSSVDAASLNDKMYAFPLTSDNGYFLYYDKSVITDPSTLEGILQQAGNKKVFMDVSNGWYIASFFLATGGTITLNDAGKQIVDFNNANGLKAGKAIINFTAASNFLTGDDNILKAGFKDKSIVAGVSGTWNANDIKASLGDNYAAAKLPTFNVDGEDYQMNTFVGCKLMGVNSHSKFVDESLKLAQFLTNQESQEIRFNERGQGPSNIEAAKMDAVKADEALSALLAQSVYGISQKFVGDAFWAPAEAFGTACEAKEVTLENLQAELNKMVENIGK